VAAKYIMGYISKVSGGGDKVQVGLTPTLYPSLRLPTSLLPNPCTEQLQGSGSQLHPQPLGAAAVSAGTWSCSPSCPALATST